MGLLKERLEQLDKETGGDLGERINSLAEKLPQMQGLRPLSGSLGGIPEDKLTKVETVNLAFLHALIAAGNFGYTTSPAEMRRARDWAVEMTLIFFEDDE